MRCVSTKSVIHPRKQIKHRRARARSLEKKATTDLMTVMSVSGRCARKPAREHKPTDCTSDWLRLMMYEGWCKCTGVHCLQIQYQAQACWAKCCREKNKSPLYRPTGHRWGRRKRAKAIKLPKWALPNARVLSGKERNATRWDSATRRKACRKKRGKPMTEASLEKYTSRESWRQ